MPSAGPLFGSLPVPFRFFQAPFSTASLSFPLLDDFREEEGEDEEGNGKEHLDGEEVRPAPAHPYIPDRADEKGEEEGPHDDPQAGAEDVVPEAHPGQAHAEIHGSKGEIDQAQVEDRGEAVALDRLVVFFQLVPDEGGGEFPAQRAADPEGRGRPEHGSHPHVEESHVGSEDGGAERGQERAGDEETYPDGVHEDEKDGGPVPGGLQYLTQRLAREIALHRGEADDQNRG